MNKLFTATASLATLLGGEFDRKPIRLPSINVQTASKPNKFTIFWKFSTTCVSGSRLVRNKAMKSSQIQFSAGKNACKTLGLVIFCVSFERKLCHVSPCSLVIPVNMNIRLLTKFIELCSDISTCAGVTIWTHLSVECYNLSWRSERIFAWIAQYLLNVLPIV